MTDAEFQRTVLDYLAKQREYVDLRSSVITELRRRWPTDSWVKSTTNNDTRFGAVRDAFLDPSARVCVTVRYPAPDPDDCVVTRAYPAEQLQRVPASEVPVEYRRSILAYRWARWRTRPFFHCDTNINLDKV